jgi:RNA polymerase sigma-70 factor, ECF subfamily
VVQGLVVRDSRAAIERVYREEGTRVWRAVLLFTGDREIASDATAEAFAQALRRGDQLRSPAAWIWRAAFRIASGELKRRSRPLQGGGVETPQPDVLGLDLLLALRELSPKQRASVVLHHYAGYTLSEVAQLIRSSPSAVSVHLNRAKKKLARGLQEEGDV